jgi:hypothetical protein
MLCCKLGSCGFILRSGDNKPQVYHITELKDVCFISDICCVHGFPSSLSDARSISSAPISPRHELSPVRSDNAPVSPQLLRILLS